MGASPAVFKYAIVLAALLFSACAKPNAALAPSAESCVTARLISNGWHADLALPADAFEPAHPLRRIFPNARYFLIGWGERGFYMDESPGVWKGVSAALPPSPSVLHAVAVETSMDALQWRDGDVVEFALSQAGAGAIARSITGSLRRDDNGDAVLLGEGRVAGRSVFLADSGNFHLFHMCNHWTAARLKEAGLPLSARVSFTAPALLRAVRRVAPPACPADRPLARPEPA